MRNDVTRLGIIPELLCKELELPFFALTGVNSEYSHSEFTKDGRKLVSWVDFVKLMGLALFKTTDDHDTLQFILRSVCLTKPEQFAEDGLYKAISRALHHTKFPYPP